LSKWFQRRSVLKHFPHREHGGRDEHTYTTKQFKSAKSTTYQALQN
jgi:hypothetical protein